MYTINPKNRECFFLRLVLNKKKGPTSFIECRTVDGIIYPSFQDTCIKLGLIGDDKECEYAMNESKLCDSPYKMRSLFTIILAFCEIANPKKIWKSMSEDFEYKIHKVINEENEKINDYLYNHTYNEVNKLLFNICGNNLSHYLIEPPNNQELTENLSILNEEKSYNLIDEEKYVAIHSQKLNSEQNYIYENVCRKIYNADGGLLFIDAPGGTGKTYLLNLILAKCRSKGKIAIAVASSGFFFTNKLNIKYQILNIQNLGIAPTLLRNGRTSHKTFKLPLNLSENETVTCNISPNSDNGKLLTECSIIIWDEAPMMHKNGFEALNRTLQDLKQNNLLMCVGYIGWGF